MPDGKRIAFRLVKEGQSGNLFWQLADGSGGLERLTTSQNLQTSTSWSRRMMAVAVTLQPGFSAAKPTFLFEGDYESSVFPLTVTPDS